LSIPKAISRAHSVLDFLFPIGFGGRVVPGEKETQGGGIISAEKIS